jgi:hypothetical protein
MGMEWGWWFRLGTSGGFGSVQLVVSAPLNHRDTASLNHRDTALVRVI